MGNHLFVIFTVLDVSLAVYLCINFSFLHLSSYLLFNFWFRKEEQDLLQQTVNNSPFPTTDGKLIQPAS